MSCVSESDTSVEACYLSSVLESSAVRVGVHSAVVTYYGSGGWKAHHV